jgi:hypothetical protein
VHREYLSRLHFEAGNFFESVPANADAYIMKRVLHDWDDDRCRALLGNVSRAMTDTARVLIVETLVEPAADQFGKWLDLNMMVVTGGRERTSEEFADLLDSVGLRIVAVHQTPTLLKVVDVVRAVV